MLAGAMLSAPSALADPSEFGIESSGVSLSNAQAGAYPDVKTSFRIAGDPTEQEGAQDVPWARLRDLSIELPPGLLGNLGAIPTCSAATFVGQITAPGEPPGPKCPAESQIGVISPGLSGLVSFPPGEYRSPLFNLERPSGNRHVVARLGAIAVFDPIFVDIRLDPKRGYAITASLVNAPAVMTQITGADTTLWGVPSDPSHDGERFDWLEAATCDGPCGAPVPSTIDSGALMINPTSCGTEAVGMAATSYADNAGPDYGLSQLEITGCESVPFAPELSLSPTNRSAAAPTGIDVGLRLSQSTLSNPRALRSADIRRVAVSLPPDVSLNTSVADGLDTCTESEVGFDPNERQILNVGGGGGPVTLSFAGRSTPRLPDRAGADEVAAMLESLPTVQKGDVLVSGRRGGPWQVDFMSDLADRDVPSIGGVRSEVQRLAVKGAGGTYTLAFEGKATAPIPAGAGAASVQAALEETGLTADEVEVSGGAEGGGAVFRIVFGGALAAMNLPQITTTSSLSGPGSFATTYPIAEGGSTVSARTVEQGGSLRFDGEAPTCPDASKIASGSVSTPLLADPLPVSVYLASRRNTPFDAPFGLYLVAADDGVLFKIAGHLDVDPETGRLVVAFENVPQLPIEELDLHFKEGNRGIATTPRECGEYRSTWRITPWSRDTPLTGTSTFKINQGCGLDISPPQLDSGSSSGVAGAFTTFSTRLERSSASPQMARVSMRLPSGLSADLAGVGRCPERDVATLSRPAGIAPDAAACPASSQVGTVTVGVGSGSPFYVEPGQAFLAGPYRDAPLSLVLVVQMAAGPFDLGPTVIRAGIFIDPRDARIRLVTDPLPTAIEGIPLDFRDLRVNFDRPGFIRNPTDCGESSVEGTVDRVAAPPAQVADRFQVGSCADLGFRPGVRFRVSGAVGRHGHPAISVALRSRGGDADIASADFSLPAGELLDLRHVHALCADDLALEDCPGGSVIGRATLQSSFIEAPLEGRIFLLKPSGKLPDLLADLHGGGFHLLLRGHTAAPPGHLRLDFPSLPDMPFSRALFSFRGGRHGIVVNSESLCRRPEDAWVGLVAHNGRTRQVQATFQPVSGC